MITGRTDQQERAFRLAIDSTLSPAAAEYIIVAIDGITPHNLPREALTIALRELSTHGVDEVALVLAIRAFGGALSQQWVRPIGLGEDSTE